MVQHFHFASATFCICSGHPTQRLQICRRRQQLNTCHSCNATVQLNVNPTNPLVQAFKSKFRAIRVLPFVAFDVAAAVAAAELDADVVPGSVLTLTAGDDDSDGGVGDFSFALPVEAEREGVTISILIHYYRGC